MGRKTDVYVDTSALIAFADRSDSHHTLFRRLFSDPPRDTVAWDPHRGARVALGEVISKAEIDYFPGPISSPYERDVAISYQLLGDPATRISLDGELRAHLPLTVSRHPAPLLVIAAKQQQLGL